MTVRSVVFSRMKRDVSRSVTASAVRGFSDSKLTTKAPLSARRFRFGAICTPMSWRIRSITSCMIIVLRSCGYRSNSSTIRSRRVRLRICSRSMFSRSESSVVTVDWT